MLQRQIMFKQLQELQRRQQLQELGDARNQDYINQLLSLKVSSGIQYAPIVSGAPAHDSQMIQHGGSSIFQGSPNGLVLSQSHSHGLGPMALSLPQCDISLYSNTASSTDRHSNLHSHLQGPYNHSANMLTMNGGNASGMSSLHPLGIDSSFMSHQGNYLSEQIGTPSDSLLTNQVCQEKDFFGQVPVHTLNRDLFSVNYSQQGISLQRSRLVLESEESYGDTGSHGTPPGQVSKMSQHTDSLDPLEQKLLYNTEENSWVSTFGNRKIGTPSLESTVENPSYIDTSPSIQSGSWSALMQSAVAESSSSDTAMQEEWSGLSFQNPEPSAENQPLNFINSEIPQNNWIDRNMQNVSSPCSDPEPLFQNSSKNYNFPDFKQSGLQIFKQKDEFRIESSHVSHQYSPRNTSNLVQTSLPPPNTWPAQCHELRGPMWLHGSTSNSAVGDIQKSFNQVNQMNVQSYSVESEAMVPGINVGPSSALYGASSDVQGETLTAQSEIMLELLNKDGISNDHDSGIQLNSKVSSLNELPLADASAEYFSKPCDKIPVSQGFGFKQGPVYAGTPESRSFFPSLSMGSSSMTSFPSDYNQHLAPATSSHLTSKFPASRSASQFNFQLKSTGAGGPEFSHFEKVAATHLSGASEGLQSVQFLTGLPTPVPDSITHGDVISPKPCNFSSDLLRPPNSVSCSLENSSEAPNAQPNQKYLTHEMNLQEFGTYSGRSRYFEPQLDKERSMHESWPHIRIPASMSRSAHVVESSRNYSGADGVVSSSLTTCTSQQPSNQIQQKDNETPGVPPGGIRTFGHYLHKNLRSPRKSEAECSRGLLLKYDNINRQQLVASAKGLLSGEQKLMFKDKAKYDMEAAHLGTSPGNVKGWNIFQEAQDNNQSGQVVSASSQDFQQMENLSQSGTQTHPIGSCEASNVANESQINLQMAPSWFKHYGTLKNGPVLPIYNPKAATDSAQPFSGLSVGSVQGHNLIMQLNSNQGSGLQPPSSATLIVNKSLPPPRDVTDQNLAVVKSKKRKLVEFDMLPWHREVNYDRPELQSSSMAELVWAQASNRRQEEAKNDAEIAEDVASVVRSKRRLIFTTQLMQQVFRPAPPCVLSTDASSNYDVLAYSAARLELGDACTLTSNASASPDDVSLDRQKISKRSAFKFSKVVEGLISRAKKLEGDLSRLDSNLSIVNIKVESQDLDKFSTINRFAKFHFRAPPGTADPTSSSGQSALQKALPQRYVKGVPMPGTLPEIVDCIPL